MNKYEICMKIGEGKVYKGAFGSVFKAKNKETGEFVAIKKFKDSEEDEVIRKTTVREVKILRMLKHENIVQLKEAFRRQGKLYLVFEYVERNLLEVLDEKGNGIEPELIQRYIYQLCKAIEFCHGQNVIHRDIKPENILISKSGVLKLCDFGFARPIVSQCPLTDYVATRWYRAPELLVGDQSYSTPVDMWAIGCLMGELIDGQPLFPGESEIDQLYCIQKVMGPIITEHKEAFLKNPHFLGMRFPDINKFETLEKKYLGKITKTALNFLKGLLAMDPAERMNSSVTVNHAFFEAVKENYSRPSTSTGINKLGYIYQNKFSNFGSNKNSGNAPSNDVKNESGDQRGKTKSSVFSSENNDVEANYEKKNGKELNKLQPDEFKPKFPMFHITEENEAKIRVKSLKKKIKIYDLNKFGGKMQKNKNFIEGSELETPGNGSKKQLPHINHYFNFENSQKKIELKVKIKDDGPDLCGGGLKKAHANEKVNFRDVR